MVRFNLDCRMEATWDNLEKAALIRCAAAGYKLFHEMNTEKQSMRMALCHAWDLAKKMTFTAGLGVHPIGGT